MFALMHALAAVETGIARMCWCWRGMPQVWPAMPRSPPISIAPSVTMRRPWAMAARNTAYAMLTQRQMKTFGLEKSDYGEMAIAQRQWAALNPYAVYRTPLTMDEYLAAAMVASPLNRYDCVPWSPGPRR